MAEQTASVESEIAQAIQKARYNETVHVTVSSADNENESQVCLVPCLDERNGGVQWNPLQPDRVPFKHLQTKRWMFPMLNDHRRNELYEKAIIESTRELVGRIQKQLADTATRETAEQSPTRTIHVLDIGSGTGLLAMMAVRALKSHLLESNLQDRFDVKVKSIEMAAAMASLATETVSQNELCSSIDVKQGHSCSLPPLTPPIDFCVSELLESGLLGEGLLPALRDAWQRHMNGPSAGMAVMIPQRARVYAQLVQGEWLTNYYGPHPAKASSTDSEQFVLSMDQEGSLLLDSRAVRLDVHADELLRVGSLEPLSAPINILEFDLGRDKIPDSAGGRQTSAVAATASGTAHGVLLWWELDLCDGVTYSTKPGKEPWQDHWHQCIQIIPVGDTTNELVANQTVTLQATHDDSRVTVALLPDRDESEAQKQRFDDTPQALISPDRAYQLNDTTRTSLLQTAIRFALETKGGDASVLDLSDFSLCAGLASIAGATNVSSVESSSGKLPLTTAYIAQIGNNLPAGNARFDILQCHAEQLSLELLGGSAADIVVAEPYYEVLEGWHLQEALNYYYMIRALKARGVVSPNACAVPSSCTLMGCAIESEQLRKAYRACGDDKSGLVSGFEHSVVNKYGDHFHEFDLALPMWQYPFQILSSSFEVGKLSFADPIDTPIVQESRVGLTTAGTCDALMVWLEYDLSVGSDSASRSMISTQGRSYRQIIRMLKEPVTVPTSELGNTALVCKCTLGGLDHPNDHDFELLIEK